MMMNSTKWFWKSGAQCVFLRVNRVLSIGVCMLLTFQSAATAVLAQEPAERTHSVSAEISSTPEKIASGTSSSNTQITATNESDVLPSAPTPQAPPQLQSSSSNPPQNPPRQPVGTAAAPYERPTGVPGSRPAGAVIAPAKQKRVRAIVVKFGLLLAGGAAIGTVVGLSRASHSQP